MATNRAGPQDVLVLDMTSIRFSWSPDRSALAALSAQGEVLGLTDARVSDPPSEVAFRAMDAALGRGSLWRSDPDELAGQRRFRVALYNPFTAEVAFGAVPATVAFTDGDFVALPVAGLPAVVAPAGPDSWVLHVGERALRPREMSYTALTRLAAAHDL